MTNIPVLVSTKWLSDHLEEPNLRILDATPLNKKHEKDVFKTISEKEAFHEGHIPGTVFVDIEKDLSDPRANLGFTIPPREQFIAKMTELGVGDGTFVVIYQKEPFPASYWASRLWWQLRYEGFENIGVLDGGLQKWLEEGRPLTTKTTVYPKRTFTGNRRPKLIANIYDVKDALNDRSTLLVHSLSSADFLGETNSFQRPGHIPDSVNVFYGLHVDPKTKKVHRDDILRNKFQNTGVFDPHKKVITYCGRGISATWNALILEKLGVSDVAVYDGSLAEWTMDLSLPMETEFGDG